MSKANRPAFPVSTQDGAVGHQDGPFSWQFPGATLLEHYAGQNMAELIVPVTDNGRFPEAVDRAAQIAVAGAKALVAELEKEQGQ